MLVDGSLSLYFYPLAKNLYACKILRISCYIYSKLYYLALATDNKVIRLRAGFFGKDLR